ncbi:MAG: hypothetical protein ACMG6H_09865 [Acidobacteriota bacterium]
MRRFPTEFSDLLTPRGLRILEGKSPDDCELFTRSDRYFANFSNLIRRDLAEACMRLLDEHLYDSLTIEQSRIPAESIAEMTENYSETLPKTIRIKTAFFKRKTARAYRSAEQVGLLRMMKSESFSRFAESLTGLKLDRELGIQISCYEQGDYAGPHNDHHPEDELYKDGFIDFHVMFRNDAVAHQYLVYEEKGHFSKIVSINVQGGVSVYRLPFWHYTTPLAAKPNQEAEARRWLLLGTFQINDD